MVTTTFKFFVHLLIAVNIHHIESWASLIPAADHDGHPRPSPQEYHLQTELKAAYKSGDIHDGLEAPITLDKIKTKLKESEIFNWQDSTLTDREKKEMNKLFDAVEIMVSSRNRQPSSVQNMFSSLRLVERAVKKQLKEGQISETLSNKFNWEKLRSRQRRELPLFTLDKATNMRVFNLNNFV